MVKNKKNIFIIIICLVIAIICGFIINNSLKNKQIGERSATEISYDFFKEEMFPLFNTGDYSQIEDLFLPCQNDDNFTEYYNYLYTKVFPYLPMELEGVIQIDNAKGNTIKGKVVYGDHDGSYNILDEYDNGWEGFGNKKVADFELIKKNGKIYLNSFNIVANYNWRTIQKDPEFLELYMTKLYTKQLGEPIKKEELY